MSATTARPVPATQPALFLPLPHDPRRLAVLRAWACDLRDRRGRFASVEDETTRTAGLLAALLGQLAAQDGQGRLFDPLHGSVQALLGALVWRGCVPPA